MSHAQECAAIDCTERPFAGSPHGFCARHDEASNWGGRVVHNYSDDEVRDLYDQNPDLLISDVCRITRTPRAAVRRILMEQPAVPTPVERNIP